MTSRSRVAAVLAGVLMAVATGPVWAETSTATPVPSWRPVPEVGPQGSGAAPTVAMGPDWPVVLERPLEVLRAEVVRCGDGFMAMAFGHDRRGRARAPVWISSDGERWTAGAEIRPDGDPSAGWTVQGLVTYRRGLFAIGGDGRELAVWRSSDCGGEWRRMRDRSFVLERDAVGIIGLEVAATDERILVIGRQGGEEIPARRWAWTMAPGGAWRRIPGGLDGTVEWGLGSTGTAFTGVRRVTHADAFADTFLVTSTDGERWTELGPLPDTSTPAIPDPARDRFLFRTTVVDDGRVSEQLLTSSDGSDWTPLARTARLMDGAGSHVMATDGVLVWIVDMGLDDDDLDWSWIGVSEDGGTTWSVSAGWPGMTFRGLTSVAATDRAVVLVSTGPRFDAVRIRSLPR